MLQPGKLSNTSYISYSSSELQLTSYFALFSKDSFLVSISWIAKHAALIQDSRIMPSALIEWTNLVVLYWKIFNLPWTGGEWRS